MIKVITGVRRCGKSYLVFNLFKKMLLERNVPDNHIIAIALDGIENVDVYVTGSDSRFLSSDILTEFRGRGDEIRVYPLSFSEYVAAFEGTEEDAWIEYMTFGGLPRILSMQTDELEELVNIIASSIGSLTNPKKLENTFKTVSKSDITDKTIKSYLEYLKDAFLIDTAIRYDIKGKKYMNTPMKIYFTDSGLRNARLGFRQIEETHLMENIIYNELKRRGYSVDVGLVEVREDVGGQRLRKQLEVDFIAYKGNNKYYIQSAFSIPDEEKKKQEERPLLNIGDSFKKIVVVGNYIKLKRDDMGITTIGIREFLKKENSLDL